MPALSIQFNVSAAYEPLLYAAQRRFAVEHAAIRSRVPETILAGLIASPVDGRVVIVSPNPKRWAIKIDEWLTAAGIKIRRRVGGYIVGPMTVWSVSPDSAGPDDPTLTLVFDAHDLDSAPYGANDGVCVGQLAGRGHWFYSHCRKHSDLLRYDGSTVKSSYPATQTEIESTRERLNDFEYARAILLEDREERSDRTSFRRFARERLYIRSDKHGDHLNNVQKEQAARQEGTPLVSFYLSRLQQKYLAKKRLALSQGRKPRFLLLKYRRGGFTTLEQGLNYEFAVRRSNSQVATLAHLSESTHRIFGIAKLYAENDPRNERFKESASRLRFPNGSTFFIGTAGSRGFARGDTLQRVHGSEVSKWCLGPNQMDRVNDLISGITGAASNGEVILETTPNGVEWFAKTYKEAKLGQNGWTTIFLPWFDDPGNRHAPGAFREDEIRDTLTDEERELIEKFGLNWAQISFRREQKREHKALFPQEYPEDDISCFLTSGTAYFDLDRLAFLISRKIQSANRKSVPGGVYEEYEAPIFGEEYVLGADTSEGLAGCDPNGFGILHRSSGRQVASLHGYFSPRSLAEQIVRYAQRYNNALAGVERNNHGHAVLLVIEQMGYSHPNFLYHFAEDRSGWDTNNATRPVMLNTLADALLDRESGWNDLEFLDECRTFKLQSGGKFAADKGAHDDRVMKWAIAEMMRNVKRRRASITYV